MRVIIVGDAGTKDAVIAAPFTDPTTPILFVKKDSIPGSVRDELTRLLPTEILVFGGTARVSDAIVALLGQLAPVTRIAGASVFSTAIAASQILNPPAPIEPPVEPPIEPPPGAVIIPAGVHSGYTIDAQPGVTYIGEPGAILDGNGDTRSAFTGSADGVTIENLEIRNYVNPNQVGTVEIDGDDLTVKGCDVHHNLGTGIKTRGVRPQILGNKIHHQHQLGLGILRGHDGLVEDNELYLNNWLKEISWGWEAGATKMARSDGLVIRNNYSHNNHGPGLWTDIDNVNILYEDNRVEDNFACGIFHEIGYSAIIRNNQIRRNGVDNPQGWIWAAGIVLAAVQDVEAYGNVIEGNRNAVTMLQQNRGDGNQGPYLTQNNLIRDNTIINSGLSGAAQDISDPAIYHSGNVWSGNTYQGANRWKWETGQMGLAEWQQFHPGDGV